VAPHLASCGNLPFNHIGENCDQGDNFLTLFSLSVELLLERNVVREPFLGTWTSNFPLEDHNSYKESMLLGSMMLRTLRDPEPMQFDGLGGDYGHLLFEAASHSVFLMWPTQRSDPRVSRANMTLEHLLY
jgi:hypothetical protein